MEKLKKLRKVLFILYYFGLGTLIGLDFMGKLNIFGKIMLGVNCAVILIYAVITIIQVIIDKKDLKDQYQLFLDCSKLWIGIHQERYRYIINGEQDEAEKYTQALQEISEVLIDYAKELEDCPIGKKKQEEIKLKASKIRDLKDKVFVPYSEYETF